MDTPEKTCLFCGSALDIEDNQTGQYCGPECAESGRYYYEETNTPEKLKYVLAALGRPPKNIQK